MKFPLSGLRSSNSFSTLRIRELCNMKGDREKVRKDVHYRWTVIKSLLL